jgi:hypothetical protein
VTATRRRPITGRRILLELTTENQWLEHVKLRARAFGWSIYHTYDSRRSTGGFPDLVLVRGTRCLFVELKKNNGAVTLDQIHWLEIISQARTIETYVWRPNDEMEVSKALA